MGSHLQHVVLFLVNVILFSTVKGQQSALGDPGMKRNGLRLAFEFWNLCNEAGADHWDWQSPRYADCFDLVNSTVEHKVAADDNYLGPPTEFPGVTQEGLNNPDLYAAQKGIYLGSLCQVEDTPNPWQFWTIMLKNGNYDTNTGLCPENGKKVPPFTSGRFYCPNYFCMFPPIWRYEPTRLLEGMLMEGSFNGTYDTVSIGPNLDGRSFFEIFWGKNVGRGGWTFFHKLKTNKDFPWLMLCLRADATKGFSAGYHYESRGMLKILPESPNFKVIVTLNIKAGGGPKSQFYLLDIGSCWKNNGNPCDGDVLTDVTRYSEMIINPEIPAWCSPKALHNCPPFHITSNDIIIYRNDTNNFPYGAYHYYCAPGNAQYLEHPFSNCDPYSNPQPQEIIQLLPHPVWADYGYPTKPGDGWVGDARTWELNAGGLSSRLYFYQDPGTPAAKRIWTSIDVGTNIFMSDKEEYAEWEVSDLDVILT